MNAFDIRLDDRPNGWLLTITWAGANETFSRLFQPIGPTAAMMAAEVGLRLALARSPEPPDITARGNGAGYLRREAAKLGFKTNTHPNRSKGRFNVVSGFESPSDR